MKKMKILSLFCLFSIFFCSIHEVRGQDEKKVTVNYRDAKLSMVLSDLSRKFGKEILFNHEEVKDQPTVTYQAKNATLSVILDNCLKKTTLSYRFVDDIVVINYLKPKNVTKSHRISGKVVDAKGDPMAGVTIRTPQTNAGAITNATGQFTIAITQDVTFMQVSFVGMKTRVVKINTEQTHYEIKLEEDHKEVEQVVVTGYGNINKKSFTGTSIQVSGEQLMKASPNNLIQSLQLFDPSFRMVANNVSGSDPNTLPEFYIRGRSGLGNTAIDLNAVSESELRNNPNLPTFILDGYEVNVEKIYDLDPSMVKSITILKDAASTAIYGSRAANGVVVIETNIPEDGQIKVQYAFNGGLSAPDLSVYNLLDARDKLELERRAGIYAGSSSDMPSVILERELPYYGKLSEINRGVDTYWLSQPVRSAFSHKHNMRISVPPRPCTS